MTDEILEDQVKVQGHISRRLSAAPLRVLAVISGFALLRGILSLIARFLLGFRRTATAALDKEILTVTEEWHLFGRAIRRATTTAPIRDALAVRLENRKRYIYLLIGFGCLATGIWVGVHFLVDGLNAGYPYLTLIGALIILAGVGLDLALYLFLPEGKGKTRLTIDLGRWHLRLCGVENEAAEQFLRAVASLWQKKA